MRFYRILIILFAMSLSSLYAQSSNTELVGRWAKGHSKAVFRKGGFTFVGNGSILEVYGYKLGDFQKLDQILLPGEINDIWVADDVTNIFTACGDTGLQVVYFYNEDKEFYDSIIGQYNTDGYACGITCDDDGYAYIADGNEGLVILNAKYSSNPSLFRKMEIYGYARDVYVVNDSTVVVAADTNGLQSVYLERYNNQLMNCHNADTLEFQPHFTYPNQSQPLAYNIFNADSVTYVSAGWGGLRMVDARDPFHLKEYGYWVDSSPKNVIDVSIYNKYAYIAVNKSSSSGPYSIGIFSRIDVSDPNVFPDPPDSLNVGPNFLPYSKNGSTLEEIVVDNDTAYVSYGHNGFCVLKLFEGSETIRPVQINVFKTADYSYDAVVTGNYCFNASGHTGIKIFDINFYPPAKEFMEPIDSISTSGEALGICYKSNRIYVADGSKGLSIIDFNNYPYDPYIFATPQLVNQTDLCYDVDVSSGSYAFLACGRDGLRVVDISYSVFEMTSIGSPINTQGSVRAVKVSNSGERVFAVDTSGVYVYDISDLPNDIELTHSLTTGDLEPLGVDAIGDSIFIANGRYGFYLWDISPGTFTKLAETAGKCTDVIIKKNTVYVTDSERGLRIYDLSMPDTLLKTGNYWTGGTAERLDIFEDRVCIADREDGLYVLKSLIKPQISISSNQFDFGSVPLGEKRTRILWIENTGNTLLEGDISITGEDSLFTCLPSEFEVPPGQSQCIKIEFKPNASLFINQYYYKTAVVSSNDQENSSMSISFSFKRGLSIAETAYGDDSFTVGLWHLNEQSGGVAYDESSNGLNGIWINTNSSDNGHFARCYRFGGVNNPGHVEFPYHNNLNFVSKPFTVELWFNMIKKPNNSAILACRGNPPTRQFALYLSPDEGIIGRVYHSGPDSRVITGSLDELKINQWYHVAVTWDTDSLRLYLNSVLKDSKLARENLVSEEKAPFSIGAAASSKDPYPFEGFIDEVRVSKVARHAWEFNVNRSHLYLKEDTLHFGKILRDRNRSIPLSIINTGGESLEVTGISSTDPNVSITPQVSQSSPKIVAVGEKETFWIKYTATVYGEFEADIVIESSDPTNPSKIVFLTGHSSISPELSSYSPDPFTLGLYHFDNPSGPTGRMIIPDSSGHGMNGIWNGFAPGSAEAKFGKALYFNGNNNFCIMDTVDGHILNSRWGGFTVEGWFNLDINTIGEMILIKRGWDTNRQFNLSIDEDDRVVGNFYNNSNENFNLISSKSLDAGKWYHIAIVMNKDSLRLYIDGRVDNSISVNGEIISGIEAIDTLSVLIGGEWKNNNCFHGYMDEIRISSVPRLPWEFSVRSATIYVNSQTVNFGNVLTGKNRTIKYWIGNSSNEDTLKIWPDNISDLTNFSASPGTLEIAPYNDTDGIQRASLEISFLPSASNSTEQELKFGSNDPTYSDTFFKIDLIGKGVDSRPSGSYKTDLFTGGLYHFEKGVGEQAADSSGYQGYAVLNNVSWTESGKFGNAVQLSGVNSWVRILDIPYQLIDESNFTIELWFNMSVKPKMETGAFSLIDIGGDKNNQIKVVFHYNYGIVAKIWDSKGELSDIATYNINSFIANQWYHLALSCDGDSIRIYVNSGNMAQGKLKNSIGFDGIESIKLGKEDEYSNYFIGIVDEFRFSNIARHEWEYNVIPKQLFVLPDKVQFPPLQPGHSYTLDFWVSNQGDEFLDVSIQTGNSDEFQMPPLLSENGSIDTILQGQGYIKIPVIYTPVNDEVSDIWTVTSDDPDNESVNINLAGSSTSSMKMNPYTVDSHTLGLYHLDRILQNTIIEDYSTPNNNGFLSNGRIANGFFDKSIVFNGQNSKIEIPYDESFEFDFEKNSFTIECFFRTDTASQTLISRGVEDSNSDINYRISLDSHGRINVYDFGTFGTNLSDNAWHHIALSYNQFTGNGSVFIDGELIEEKKWDNPPLNLDDRPLIIGAFEQTDNVYSNHFKGRIDEVRISDVPRKKLEFSTRNFSDYYNVNIESISPIIPRYNHSLDFDIHVSSGLNIEYVNINYREGGSVIFSSVNASFINDSTYECTIPAEELKLGGLEYFIEVITSTQDTITNPRINPENNPIAVTVEHKGLNSPIVFHHRQYKMFSIPFNLDTTDVKGVLEDDLGQYNPYQWRLFYWHRVRGKYRAYNDTTKTEFNFTPGRAYWMTTHLEQKFDIGQGTTVTTDSGYVVNVAPGILDTLNMRIKNGWNMIGVPFNFSVKWSDCSVSSKYIDGPFYWDGTKFIIADELEPWKGYFICNQQVDAATLTIPPRKSDLSKNSKRMKKTNQFNLESDEWMFTISAVSKNMQDIQNYAGVKNDAEIGWDAKDIPEPPPVGDYISLYFYHDDWNEHCGRYTGDIKKTGENGYIWDFIVESKIEDNLIVINYELKNSLPQDWDAYIFDIDRGVAYNIFKENQVNYNSEENKIDIHHFRLVTGTEDFIKQNSNDIPLVPVKFELSQNFPNPFNNTTLIKYSLPKNSNVQIVIFNSLGQQICELVDRREKSGLHYVEWNGKNSRGIDVSSGVYLYRLKTSDRVKVRKMVFIK